jgi:hypothetical protein
MTNKRLAATLLLLGTGITLQTAKAAGTIRQRHSIGQSKDLPLTPNELLNLC